jgi:demethylmenaquinone methyltransferase/2-methoxy-6-polyprenyl-1,4-benzoquinol methylase
MKDSIEIRKQRANQRAEFAGKLFGGIAANYGWPARMFSFGQYDRWHGRLVEAAGDLSGKRVLDLCTGTGFVARRMVRGDPGVQVVGVDLSPDMLSVARRNLRLHMESGQVSLLQGDAQRLPFADESFDVVVFTYLLRYVEDVPSTIGGLARLVRSGGTMVSLEFGAPERMGAKQLWKLYTRVVMPAGTFLISPGWRRVGAFLGPSISRLYREYPLERQKRLWEESGIRDVRMTRLSLGGAVIIKGTKANGGA